MNTILIYTIQIIFCIGVFYGEVNPVDCFTIEGIDVKKITLKSRIENSITIVEQIDNVEKTFLSCELCEYFQYFRQDCIQLKYQISRFRRYLFSV